MECSSCCHRVESEWLITIAKLIKFSQLGNRTRYVTVSNYLDYKIEVVKPDQIAHCDYLSKGCKAE